MPGSTPQYLNLIMATKKLYFNLIERNIISTEIKNLNKEWFKALSKGQIEFYNSNPDASYWEIWNKKRFFVDIEAYRQQILSETEQVSLQRRKILIPDYKLENAIAGYYEEETNSSILSEYKRIVDQLRAEFYRLKPLIDQAGNIQEIDEIFNHNHFSSIQ